jgi:hypothetical protein
LPSRNDTKPRPARERKKTHQKKKSVEKKKIAKIHFSGHTLEIATLSNRMIVDAPDALWGDYFYFYLFIFFPLTC